MNIKSEKWYKNQIKCLENAAKNTAILIESCDWTTNPEKMNEIGKRNRPIQQKCNEIYTELNHLKHEYNLYYR